MHELSIASAILDTVRQEAERRPGARVTKIGLRVGERAGVDRDALSFSFEVLVQGTEFERVALAIESCPVRYRCRRCRETITVSDYDTSCPRCHIPASDCVGGTELDLAYLEMEE